jgi:hypothetical protein
MEMAEQRDKSEILDVKDEDAPFPLTELDRIGLNQKDEDFKLHTWDDLKQIIGTITLPISQNSISHEVHHFPY